MMRLRLHAWQVQDFYLELVWSCLNQGSRQFPHTLFSIPSSKLIDFFPSTPALGRPPPPRPPLLRVSVKCLDGVSRRVGGWAHAPSHFAQTPPPKPHAPAMPLPDAKRLASRQSDTARHLFTCAAGAPAGPGAAMAAKPTELKRASRRALTDRPLHPSAPWVPPIQALR